MNLFLLMTIYQLKHGESSLYAMLDVILEQGMLDKRIDRDILKGMILKDLGNMKPRWNDTDVFIMFAAVGLRQMQREITKNIDLFESKYNPLLDYDMQYIVDTDGGYLTSDTGTVSENPDIIETRKPDLTETRTPDLTETETPNLKTTETPDLKVIENNINTGDGTATHYVSADNKGDALSMRTKDDNKGENRKIDTVTSGNTVTLNEGSSTLNTTGKEEVTKKGTETVTRKGSQTKVNDLTKTNSHDEHERRTEQGRKRMAGELIEDAMAVNAYNIYQMIVERFMENNMIMVW